MKKKLFRWMILSMLVLILIFIFTNAYKLFLHPLEVTNEVSDNFGDLIFVPGGGVKKENKKLTIADSTRERLELAIKYYKKKNMTILISGSSLYKKSPIRKEIKEFLTKKKIAERHILFEGKSTTSFENIKNLKCFLKNKSYKEILIATSPYHQRRIKKMLDYFKIKNYKFLRMDFSEINKANNIKSRLRNIKLIFREYFALLKFLILRK